MNTPSAGFWFSYSFISLLEVELPDVGVTALNALLTTLQPVITSTSISYLTKIFTWVKTEEPLGSHIPMGSSDDVTHYNLRDLHLKIVHNPTFPNCFRVSEISQPPLLIRLINVTFALLFISVVTWERDWPRLMSDVAEDGGGWKASCLRDPVRKAIREPVPLLGGRILRRERERGTTLGYTLV